MNYRGICVNCREIHNQINDLKNLILSLQDDIKALRENNTNVTPSGEFDFEEVIAELSERNNRKQNIILFGVQEQDQTKPPQSRIQGDKTVVTNICNIIDSNVSIDNIKPIRLGRSIGNKPRPIKMSLHNESEVMNFIRKAKNLKDSPYKNVSVSFDRTRRQIDHYKKLKEELNHKNSENEEKFIIKYFNGVPKIVRALN